MSTWNHSLCRACFQVRRPTITIPHRVIDGDRAMCCSCGNDALPGLFYRDDPKLYKYCGLSPREPGGSDAA
jgi:hypothetical protein